MQYFESWLEHKTRCVEMQTVCDLLPLNLQFASSAASHWSDLFKNGRPKKNRRESEVIFCIQYNFLASNHIENEWKLFCIFFASHDMYVSYVWRKWNNNKIIIMVKNHHSEKTFFNNNKIINKYFLSDNLYYHFFIHYITCRESDILQ